MAHMTVLYQTTNPEVWWRIWVAGAERHLDSGRRRLDGKDKVVISGRKLFFLYWCRTANLMQNEVATDVGFYGVSRSQPRCVPSLVFYLVLVLT